jgi:hypothetical protein
VNETTTIAKFSIIKYGKNSELSQLTEGDCLRSDAKKLSPIKNLNCIMNEVNKLTTHFQNVDKDAFFNKYGRLMEIGLDEKELRGMSLDWMQSCSELEAMEIDFNDCQGSAEYFQEKFAQVQFELMDRIGKYEDLNKKYMELESRLMGIAKEDNKRKGFEAFETELAVKRNEIKVMRIKLDKEREKVKYLDEKLAAMEKHKD